MRIQIYTEQWAWSQVRQARRYGIAEADYAKNLSAARDHHSRELRSALQRRHAPVVLPSQSPASEAKQQSADFDNSIRRHARDASRVALQALRQISFLQSWLQTAAIEDDATVCLRWQINRTHHPVLLNGKGYAVARLRRGKSGRGFGWDIFIDPVPLTGRLYDWLETEGGRALCSGEAPRRMTAMSALLAELDKRSIGLFASDTLDIPLLEWDGRWWRAMGESE